MPEALLEKMRGMITFHGELPPDNPNRMFDGGRFSEFPEPAREVDVVIVGGGAGGLTAAYRLKQRNILLLEALPELGGNSMYCEWRSVPFSLGGQYIGVRGTWADSTWDLCAELGLEPEIDKSPLTVVFPGGRLIQNPYSARGLLSMPLPWRVKRDIMRFYLIDMPRIDCEARKDELDRIPFSEILEKYSREFRDWYELLAKPYPRTCDASAYYAIESAQDKDYAGDAGIASFPGGLGLINKTLAERVEEAGPGRLLTGAFAYKVRHDTDGTVLVTYWCDGKIATVRAKAAIINAESNVALKIVDGIPAETRAAMEGMRRFSYPTFHFCSSEPIYRSGYRLGVMDCTIQAITAQDWFSRDRDEDLTKDPGKGPDSARPNILSCFNKMSLEDVDVVKDKEAMIEMAAQALEEIDARLPGAAAKVEATHVFLRTRNYCVPYPGYITQVFPKLGRAFGNIHFANAEYLDPVTRFPEAVTSGATAAAEIAKTLG